MKTSGFMLNMRLKLNNQEFENGFTINKYNSFICMKSICYLIELSYNIVNSVF